MGMRNVFVMGLFAASAVIGVASAEVPPEVAARLGQDLTPLGSQKSGNKDGSIPEWTGGLSTVDRKSVV